MPDKIYKLGDCFKTIFNNHFEYGMLVQVDYSKINLIHLPTANRWLRSVEIKSPFEITEEEINKLFDQAMDQEFVQVELKELIGDFYRQKVNSE